MTGLAGRRALEWQQTYQQSRYSKEFVETRTGRIVSAPAAKGTRRRDFGIGQLVTLSRRNLLLKLRDRIQTAILLAQAPLFAVLVSIVFFGMTDQEFTDPAAWAQFSGKVASAHFLMVVAAVWFGCNNAARDIVGETTIFQRERMVNLKLPSYVFSKIAVLAMLCVFQCSALLGIVYFFSDLSGSFLTLLAVLVSASLTGTALGLLISAVSPTTEAAIAFLPVVLLPFILLERRHQARARDADDGEADLGGHADALGLRSELSRGSAQTALDVHERARTAAARLPRGGRRSVNPPLRREIRGRLRRRRRWRRRRLPCKPTSRAPRFRYRQDDRRSRARSRSWRRSSRSSSRERCSCSGRRVRANACGRPSDTVRAARNRLSAGRCVATKSSPRRNRSSGRSSG